MERIEPIRLNFEDGTEYVLEFSRKTVSDAEKAGFVRTDVTDKLMTRIPELFYFAFKMHHPTIKREATDKILFEDLEGLTDELIERLIDLFNAPYETLINDRGKPKNPKLTVIM